MVTGAAREQSTAGAWARKGSVSKKTAEDHPPNQHRPHRPRERFQRFSGLVV
jgi:hypothetical protein